MEHKNYCLKRSNYLKLITFSLVSTLFISCSSGEAEKEPETVKPVALTNKTLESFGELFIAAVKEEKFEKIENYIPSRDDIEDIVMKFDGDEEKKKQILASSEENAKKIQENTKKGFDKIFEKGKDAGLNWENVEFTESEYNLTQKNGVEYAELTIHFKYKELTYAVFISECINTERGWLIFDEPKWKG